MHSPLTIATILGCLAAFTNLFGQSPQTRRPPNPLPGQIQKAPRRGAVEGDVFYLTRGGDVKRGAGLTVHLLTSEDSVLALLEKSCAKYKELYAPLESAMRSGNVSDWHFRQADTLHALTMAKADIILAAAIVKSVSSGINAHYRITDVPVGRYLLHTRWPITIDRYDRIYQWLVPIEIVPGPPKTVDLDTDAENSNRVYCGIK